MAYTLSLTLGAALLAVWLDTRFPGIRPKTAAQGLTHAAVGVFTMLGAAGLLQLVYGIPDKAFLAVVLGVFLPALVYALLAGFWMLRALANLTFAGPR
jgi:hypothetical protein